MKKATVLAVALVCALATSAFAQSPAVGEMAPEFGGANWVMNPPATDKVSELRGQVIVVEHWGTH
ncbi:MAG: hypothetical protein AB7K09_01560 [Planctomycetota bacterium]